MVNRHDALNDLNDDLMTSSVEIPEGYLFVKTMTDPDGNLTLIFTGPDHAPMVWDEDIGFYLLPIDPMPSVAADEESLFDPPALH